MEKNYLSPKEIINLKKNLMSTNKKGKSKSHSASNLSSEFYKMYNKEIGLNFENNIRKIVEIYYGWKKVPLKRKILYREITWKENIELVTNNKNKIIIIKDKQVIFHLNENKSFDIFLGNVKEKTINNDKPYEFVLLGEKIIVDKPMEFEFDRVYENFNLKKFNNQEIANIWKNIHKSKFTDFNKLILELELNREKITDLLEKLERDRNFIEVSDENNYLYIGIINYKSLNREKIKEFIKKNANLNFIILGIKDSQFAGKDVTKFHDWEEIEKMKLFEKKIAKLEKDNFIIKKELIDIKAKLKSNNDLLIEIKRFLMNKRNRGEESSDDEK